MDLEQNSVYQHMTETGQHLVIDGAGDRAYFVAGAVPDRKFAPMLARNALALGEANAVEAFQLVRAGVLRFNLFYWRYTLVRSVGTQHEHSRALREDIAKLRKELRVFELDSEFQDLLIKVTCNGDDRLCSINQLAEVSSLLYLQAEDGALDLDAQRAKYEPRVRQWEGLYQSLPVPGGQLEQAFEAGRLPVDDVECLKDAYVPEYTPAFVSMETDLNLDGMEGADRTRLATLLRSWNKGQKRVFSRRHGLLTVAHSTMRIDLNNAFVQTLPWYDTLVSTVKERRVPVHYE